MTVIDLAALGLLLIIAMVLLAVLVRGGAEHTERREGANSRTSQPHEHFELRQNLNPSFRSRVKRSNGRRRLLDGELPDETVYRVQPDPERESLHWNPFDAEQSRSNRARSARLRTSAPRSNHYYQLLGVDVSATDEQIHRAYKRRVAQLHPDQFHSEPERKKLAEDDLKKVIAAMETLRDPLLRARYDAGGETPR